ncbi:MAG: sulfurtransferase-like selenium metabolism protein YedF [Desulfuromonadales bacterium]|uniref:sulfurtransferase-like selenium metabolism protein YedF n=1 Tax=Desulfuromonas sp. KJ2020 TaxID=2919173 RepID=UPI0020A7C7D1|nr:sulfurtransferase-like selenium metabolism protein YedF [Desulfuromonas sp. KJ2020]MCP3177104.1 sulfurtransferase-like selenium metabolism protein YedF [Desulfuromonas sp. KJ2020]
MDTLDCRGKKCPQPVIETRKVLLANPAASQRVLVSDETARQNVSRLAESLGRSVIATATEGGFALEITAGAIQEAATSEPAVHGKTVVFVSSDKMGSGDDELGHILMKNFIFTLLEINPVPDALYFVNAGVKLTTKGSDVLEALARLADRGADIASCGLCLEFFDLKESLAVGRATNMLDTVETLSKAGRIIRP